LVGRLEGKWDNLGDIGVGGKIILKLVLNEYEVRE
jgi:hypothetical protein